MVRRRLNSTVYFPLRGVSSQHEIEQCELSTADADFELPIFVAMAPGQRNRPFAVDQTRNIGGILTAQAICLFISGHRTKVSPFAANRSPAFRAGGREMVEAAGQ